MNKRKIIFCYTHRSVHSPIVIREVSSNNSQKQTQTHSQSLGGAHRSHWRGGERIVGVRGVKITWRTQSTELSRAHRGSQRERKQSQNLHRSALGALHIYYCCVVWLSCGTTNSGVEGVSDSFACPQDPMPPTWVPQLALIQIFVPSLIASCYVVLGWYPWKVWSFLKKNRRGDLGEGETGNWED